MESKHRFVQVGENLYECAVCGAEVEGYSECFFACAPASAEAKGEKEQGMGRREFYGWALAGYLFVSVLLWVIRLMPSQPSEGSSLDCELRYVDFIFPLTRLHCPVSGAKEPAHGK